MRSVNAMVTKVDEFIETHESSTLYFYPINLPLGHIRGWISKTDNYCIVFYNADMSLSDQLITLKHECYHTESLESGTLIFGDDATDWEEEETTQRKTALEALPLEKIIHLYKTGGYDNDYDAAADLGVSLGYLQEVKKLYAVMFGSQLPPNWV